MEKPTSSYFHLGSFLLSRIGSFAFLHVNVVILFVFLLNDPLSLGWNTIDAREVLGAKECEKFNLHNFLVNFGWFLTWWIQHSGMARKKFKEMTGLLDHPIERALFGTVANVVLLNFIWRWRPVTNCERWDPLQTSVVATLISLPIIAIALFVILYFLYVFTDHVFGTARYAIAPGTKSKPQISWVFPYNMVRHPTAAGFLFFFWSIPSYTPNHIYFAALWTAFILAGTSFEEKGLVNEFGHEYIQYRQQVGQFFPRMKWFAKTFTGSGSSSKTATKRSSKKS